MTRILSEVVLERLPEGLNALADDAEAELSGDKKKTEEGSGMPGQKKRKVAELAETIDKQLEVDPHVETVRYDSRIPDAITKFRYFCRWRMNTQN